MKLFDVRGRVKRFFDNSRPAEQAFNEALAALKPGDVALDCGANLGVFTERMAATGATVHAFEPDPYAFEALTAKFAGQDNVVLHNAGISNRAGTAKLYFHKDRDADPARASQSSSLEATKTNIDLDNYHEVRLIDAAEFVDGLGRVRLLKMDVEGHEIEIINRLIEGGCINRIDQAFVEVHDRKNPALKEPTAALRARLAALNAPFNLDWH